MPNGQRSNSCIFSLPGCGAWSVAIASIVPRAEPVDHGGAIALAAQRRLHLVVAVVGRHLGVGIARSGAAWPRR